MENNKSKQWLATVYVGPYPGFVVNISLNGEHLATKYFDLQNDAMEFKRLIELK